MKNADVIWVGPALIEVLLEGDPDILAIGGSNYTATNPYLDVKELFANEGPKTT